jgi:outer membrane murein-binding lipoprotein Lpp
MTLSSLVKAIVAGCAAVVISAIPSLAGQMPQAPPQATTAKAKPASGMAADMAAKCQAMMADHEKMMAEMKAADERLDDLVTKMNAASGMEKADATAAVVSEMVAQRLVMRDGMMKMEHEMMAHMMEHMQAGKDSMAMCPMMKQMGGMKH